MQHRIRLLHKLILVSLGVILSLVLLELGLRLANYWYFSSQAGRNARYLSDKSFRILCIGESTTGLGGKLSYPRQLEGILRSELPDREISVVNGGIPGVTTKEILKALPGLLEKYDPHMVIAMMGINDLISDQENAYSDHVEKDTVWAKVRRYIHKSKLYGLFAELRCRIENRNVAGREHLASGQEAIILGDEERAVTEFEMAIAADPGNREGYLELARVLMASGDFIRAEELFKKAISVSPDRPQTYDELAWYYVSQKKFSEAEAIFKKLLSDFGEDWMYYLGLGQCYYGEQRKRESEAEFDKALRSSPSKWFGLMTLGDFFLDQDEYGKARQMYSLAAKTVPDRLEAYIGLGRCYEAQGMQKEAEAAYKKAVQVQPGYYMAQNNLASYLYGHGREEEAGKITSNLVEEYFSVRRYSQATRDNFLAIKRMVVQKGIQFVCMQYPCRPVKPLMRLFKVRGVIFIDNETAFKNAIKREGFGRYFSDRFAGDFGHCTSEGNRILAENAAQVLLKEYFHK